MHDRGKTSSGNTLRRQGTVSKDRMVKVPGAHTDDRWKGKGGVWAHLRKQTRLLAVSERDGVRVYKGIIH